MDCSRHPRVAPFAVVPLIAILLLIPSVSACALAEAEATTAHRADAPHSFRTIEPYAPPRPGESRHSWWTPTDRGRSVEDRELSRRYRPSRHAANNVEATYGTDSRRRGFRPSPLLVLGAATVLLFLAAWRGPSSSRGSTASAVTSPQSVVCLACRRCSRVVDIPRERLSRHLFCPRCGATLPREV